MQSLLSKNILYSFLLMFLPALAAVSWLNIYFNNTNLELFGYITTFIVPAIVASYGAALLGAERLHRNYKLTLPRVSFSLVCFTLILILFSFGFSFFGFNSQFVTLNVAGSANPEEQAAQFYSAQLMGGMILLVIFYSIAVYAFGEKSFVELFQVKVNRKMKMRLRKAFRLAF